jgi:hypothetical protein
MVQQRFYNFKLLHALRTSDDFDDAMRNTNRRFVYLVEEQLKANRGNNTLTLRNVLHKVHGIDTNDNMESYVKRTVNGCQQTQQADYIFFYFCFFIN